VLKKKIWANFQRIIELFTQKIVTKLSVIWIWDAGSGKNLFRILDPGSGSATLLENLNVDLHMSLDPDPKPDFFKLIPVLSAST
jgi:hypothetical protein